MRSLWILCLLLRFCSQSIAWDDQARLVRDLFRDYNPLLRPVATFNDTVTVSFAMTLTLLIYVNERQQVMKTNGYTVLEWIDPQFVWKVSDYGGISAIRVPVEKVWTPDIVLLTNTDGKFGPSYRANAVIYNTGSVNWMPPFIYKSSCQIAVDYFPFDQQECVMRFSSWTYTAREVDIQTKQIVVDVTNYLRGGIWDLVDARINRVAYDMVDISTRVVEPRVDMLVTIVIRRKTLFYTVNLLIPTVLIAFMTVFVFLLPTVAGEKITLSISLTLTIVVFLLLVSKILPPAETMPLISRFLLFIFIMNLLSVCVTVITINLNYRSPKTHDMPDWVRRLFLVKLPRILLMSKRPPSHLRRRKIVKTEGSSNGHQNGILQKLKTGRRRTRTRKVDVATNTVYNPIDYDDMDQSEDDQERDIFVTEDNPDKVLVENSVEFIATHMERNNEIKSVEEDWKYLALVIDRVLLWIFFWGTCAGSMSILLSSEHLFTYVDEADTIKRLTLLLQ